MDVRQLNLDIEPEQWRPVVGMDGRYSVSTFGRVRSEPHVHTKGRILSASPKNGYKRVRTALGELYVHVAVLEAFIGPRPPGQEARHLDRDRWNAALSNLAWGTPVENQADKRRHGTQPRGAKVASSKLTEDDVRAIRASREKGVVLARRYSVNQVTISNIRHRVIWRHVI